jgi:endonuclease YncB( thermonuclease family)
MAMILDQDLVLASSLWLSLIDSKEINIQLIYSWQSIDDFYVDTWSVLAIDNQKKSFHRFVDTKNIIASQIVQNYNIWDWFVANPWMVYDEISPPSDPELMITEVYFDWDEERFEITNVWLSEFSGDLDLYWNLDFTISTIIPSWISIVFANSLYSMFQTGTNIQTITNSISFDTGEINLDLIRSGQILDNFFAHQTQVEYYQEYETSFEKIGKWNDWTTTVVWLNWDRYYNTNRWIAANPTKYFTTWENLIDVTQSREEENYNQEIPIDCDDFWDTSTANISEVYYWNNLYQPYIEIITQDNVYDYYSYIMLQWSALSWSLAFDSSDMEVNKRFLISATDQRYNEWRDSLYDPNFSLNLSGRITLYWRDDWSEEWTILDIVYLNWGEQWNSLYVWNQTNQCADVFDYQDKFSPWLSIGQSQFIDITPDPIIQYISVWWWWGGSYIPDQNKFKSSPNLTKQIEISTIKHYWDLQILTLKNKSNQDISLRDFQLQSLDGTMQSVKWNTIFAKTNMSFVGNYNFPTNQDYCINLLKDWDVVDRYCRGSMIKASEKDEQNILNQLKFRINEDEEIEDEDNILPEPNNLLQTNIIKIIDIDYDPPWSDVDNETITLLLLTWNSIDLSNYTLQYTKDGKSTNKSIEWILTKWWQQIFKWNYSLPNSTKDMMPVVVNLIEKDKNHILDTYSYNPNKIKEIPDGDYQVLSVIDGDTVKISYLDQDFNIRLAGIDAPESSALRCGKVECFGKESKEYLQSLLQNQTIQFILDSTDDFDRFVGYIFLNWENINEKMIKNGYAREYSHKWKNYKYQSEFQSAQIYAQKNFLWLRGSPCHGTRLCPVDNIFVNENYVFNIENILYDPEWVDTNREEITISMIQGFPISLADGFYLMVNNTKKTLKKYWSISPGESITLVWTFWFPNTKKTTVSLMYEDTVFDTYIYDPALDKLLEEEKIEDQLTWDVQEQIKFDWINIKIKSIIPNPFGKDSLWEEIWLLYTFDPSVILSVNEESINTEIENFETLDSSLRPPTGRTGSEWQALNLSDWYFVKMWDTKRYLKWELVANQETLIIWNFAFPNKASCVEVGKKWNKWQKDIIFDKFCYPQPEEWQKFYISNWNLESINTIDFTILKNAKLQNIWNQICLTYWSEKFYCKNMPYSKLSTKRLNQNKLYKEYFDTFEDYLKNNWKVMYYNSDIKNYFNLLNQIEKAISNWMSTFELDGILYQTSEFKKMYESQYPSNAYYSIQKKILDIVPSPFIQKYEKLRKEYIEYLMDQ